MLNHSSIDILNLSSAFPVGPGISSNSLAFIIEFPQIPLTLLLPTTSLSQSPTPPTPLPPPRLRTTIGRAISQHELVGKIFPLKTVFLNPEDGPTSAYFQQEIFPKYCIQRLMASCDQKETLSD
jgi:hypothetical protein